MSWLLEQFRNNAVAWLALIISVASVAFTVVRYRRDFGRQESQDHLSAAIGQLERAYEEFQRTCSDRWSGLPAPDRLTWLTVARMLKESEATAAAITEASHKTLYDHARTFWRGRFYDLLRPLHAVPLNYFARSADEIIGTSGDARQPISPKSLRIILGFLEWPEGKPDPIGAVEPFTDQEIDHMRSFRYRPVADYLDARDAMLTGGEDRKGYWRKQWPKESN